MSTEQVSQLKAIETRAFGCRFRSRLEARIATFLQAVGVKWQYEQEGFELPDGTRYLPDFYLPEMEKYLEVKAITSFIPAKQFYLAGKMTGWRGNLNARGHGIVGPHINGKMHDVPFGLHAQDDVKDPETVVLRCKEMIHEADTMFAWIGAGDSFGTIAEIGYAAALSMNVVTGLSNDLLVQYGEKSTPFEGRHGIDSLNDFWFIQHLSRKSVFAATPQDAFDEFFPLSDEEKKCAALAKAAESDVLMVCGDPMEEKVQLFEEDGTMRRNLKLGGLGRALRVEPGAAMIAAVAARSARFEHGEQG